MCVKAVGSVLVAFAFVIASFVAQSTEFPVTLEWDFSQTAEDRVWTDFKADPALQGKPPAAIAMACSVFEGGATVRAVTLHVHAGKEWRSVQVDPSAFGSKSLRIPLAMFSPHTDADALTGSCEVRISVWRSAAPGSGRLKIDRVYLASPAAVAVLAGGRGSQMEALAQRVRASLSRERIDCDLVENLDGLPERGDLMGAEPRLAIVPDASSLPPHDVKRILSFVHAGGRVIIYYCSDPAIAETFGLKPGTWNGNCFWCAIYPDDPALSPYPHRTENAIVPKVVSGNGARVEARFVSAYGRTGEPAVTVSKVGAWFSHIPALPSPAAARHLAMLVRTLVPAAAPSTSGSSSEPPLNADDLRAAGISAAWLPAAPGFPGGVDELPDLMRENGLQTLFTRLDALGHSERAASRFLSAARKSGVSVHAWVDAFETIAVGRWEIPHGPEARGKRVQAVMAMLPPGFAGVQLDYVRVPEGVPVTPELTEDVSRFVRAFSREFRRTRQGASLSAAVFPTPEAAALRGQDWPRWVREGWVDFVAPMIYTEDPAAFARDLAMCRVAVPANALLPGIAACADEASPGRASVRAQVAAAKGCRGVSFYALDWALASLIGFTEFKEQSERGFHGKRSK